MAVGLWLGVWCEPGVSAWGKSVVLQLVTVHELGKKCRFLEVLAGTRALRWYADAGAIEIFNDIYLTC